MSAFTSGDRWARPKLETMKLSINGHERELPDGLSVAELLVQLDLKAPKVAVELNAHVVVKARHSSTLLSPGDRVEIVTFVGGG
jgi:sulfur carrier protein